MIGFMLKRTFFALAWILVSPLVLMTWIEKVVAGPTTERVFGACKELLSTIPTVVGGYLRSAYYWSSCTGVSPDVYFHLGSMIAHRDVKIGKGTAIGVHSLIGYADIGERVLFAAFVSVISGKYQHGKPEERSGGDSVSEVFTRIAIGSESWIGQGAIVLADIGRQCTVGAGSVVYNGVQDGSTVLGNPARRVNLK